MAELTKALEKIEDVKARALRAAADEAFANINVEWPADTFWSIVNHQVVFGQGENFDLDPPVKPNETGELFPLLGPHRVMMETKIMDMPDEVDIVKIGNAVPYAPDVGFVEGQGVAIYEDSARAAAQEVRKTFRRK